MRRLPGVTRPGIAVTIPTFFGPIILSDVGANPEPKPHHLHQYGHMATIYARQVVGIENPRVALLSIGGEEGKGTPLVKDTAKLMKADQLLTEGLAAGLFKTIAHELFDFDPELAMKFEPIVKIIYKKHDYHEYGGAPLRGTNGICFICHGSSQARTITAAIRNAIEYARKNVNEAMAETLAKVESQAVAK